MDFLGKKISQRPNVSVKLKKKKTLPFTRGALFFPVWLSPLFPLCHFDIPRSGRLELKRERERERQRERERKRERERERERERGKQKPKGVFQCLTSVFPSHCQTSNGLPYFMLWPPAWLASWLPLSSTTQLVPLLFRSDTFRQPL